jgi:flagellar basal-body rod protein FlgG
MMRSLWIAKTGLEGQQIALDTIANNLANVQTTGYKEERPVFQDLIYQTLRQPGAQVGASNQLPTGLQLGTGAQVAATEKIFTEGNLNNTGSDLNIAINGKGFLQVTMPDGTTAYTRDGTLEPDQNGQLTTASGYPLNPPITIPANALTMTIGNDGTVSVTQPGSTSSAQVGQIQLATFINPAGLQSVGQNLYLATDASGAANVLQPGIDGAGTISQQYLETSNVNVAEELVNMITTQRAYDMNSKAVTASDQMLQRLAQM